jgi:hypothetical protein
MEQPTHAIFYNDNSTGDNDRFWVFAFIKDGVWMSFETHKPMMEYVGDEILKIVPL